MSGHSKWSTIKRQKGSNDTKRGQLFTKLGRSITIAVRKGGHDPNANPTLRAAIDEARGFSMPKDNIERAILKGSGASLNGSSLIELNIEAYGPLGVAFNIMCLTDNRNRTVSEVRNIFSRSGGSLAEAGSTSYIFSNDPDNPIFTIPVENRIDAKRVIDLSEEVENLDDVQKVYSNFEIPDSILVGLGF